MSDKPKTLVDTYETPEYLVEKPEGVDEYGRVKPRYILVNEDAYKRVIDGQTTYQVLKDEGFSVEHLPAICNPRHGRALYRVGEYGLLVLVMTNFEDDRNA